MAGEMLSIDVPGVPVPQGSMRAFMPRGARFPVVTSDNTKLKDWRNLVTLFARQKCSQTTAEPCRVSVQFRMPRPKAAKNRRHPTKKPDLDKLVRATFDSLTGVVWEDDSQVVWLSAIKRYVNDHEQPGCEILVYTEVQP
jgi:crossover junction endodeoxyribonuclease RusA